MEMLIKLVLGLMGLASLLFAMTLAGSLGIYAHQWKDVSSIPEAEGRRIITTIWGVGIFFVIGWALTIIATAY